MRVKDECERIISKIIEEGFRLQISKKDLEKIIMDERGLDQRTIRNWINALVNFGYIKQINMNVYEINPLATPQIFTKLKENPQTKMM